MTTELLVAGGVGVLPLVGVVITLLATGRREHRNWLNDRRLDAYARFAVCIAEVASATETYGETGYHLDRLGLEFFADAQAQWQRAHEAFNEAQHRAALVAGKTVLPVVDEVSGKINELVDAAVRAAGMPDPATLSARPATPQDLADLKTRGAAIPALRDRFMAAARKELHG